VRGWIVCDMFEHSFGALKTFELRKLICKCDCMPLSLFESSQFRRQEKLYQTPTVGCFRLRRVAWPITIFSTSLMCGFAPFLNYSTSKLSRQLGCGHPGVSFPERSVLLMDSCLLVQLLLPFKDGIGGIVCANEHGASSNALLRAEVRSDSR
jgi:hypothetical protein